MKSNKLTQTQISILDFWHKIEFFLPYDLQEAFDKISKNQIYLPYNYEDIENISTEELWCNPYLGENEIVTGFELFIGVYNKNELSEQLREMLNLTDDSKHVRFIDNVLEQQGDKKGLSCCARLVFDEFGRLDPYKTGNIEISTAPWAIGQIRLNNGDLSCLDFNRFDAEMMSLKEDIANFSKKYIATQVTEENIYPSLNGENLIKLIEVVMDWMNFQSNITTLPYLYLFPRKGKKEKNKEGTNDIAPFIVQAERIQISIMNSFFASDLAKVIQSGNKCEDVSSPLIEYLSDKGKRIDLYHSLEGKECIIEHLKPEYMNKGHWFTENAHHMSLMQQFAINTIFKEVDKKQRTQSLFSVNGPPGTGKTTLLRDIFAENLVRRASVLAHYPNVKSTFKEDKFNVTFGKTTLNLLALQDDLTGYEMVVTSSNNAAVQNISEELPQVKALGKNWQDAEQRPKVTYLQSVARNVVACKINKKRKEYIDLEPQQSPWGLIACVLGRKEKRNFFVEQFANPLDKDANGFREEYFDNIFSWRKKYEKSSFNEAKKQFLAKLEDVNQHIALLTKYMEVFLAYSELDKDNFEEDIRETEIKIERAESLLEILEKEYYLIEQSKPNLLTKLFSPKKRNEYSDKVKENISKQLEQKEMKVLLEDELFEVKKNQNEKNNIYKELMRLNSELGLNQDQEGTKIHIPSNMFENLEEDKWQISGFWSDENLNQKRAELFQLALELHEAWIVESIRYGFSANILSLKNLISGQHLQGNPKAVEEAALIIWQSLFMMVPVASTTFASVSFLFRYLGERSLGWIFVDEAGQAIPQAAVGALWRAKNAVIVGDPLQIEPVFTTPEKLTDLLLEASKVDVDFDVAPHKTSVQVLADKANPYGANLEIDGLDTWIGSPLRVHRRCFEPMFSISNHIAYQGKMVYGLNKVLPEEDPWLLGSSSWLHLSKGSTQQYDEIELIVQIFRQLCIQRYKDKKLPPVYIISPFKKVCDQIRKRLKDNRKLWSEFEVKSNDWVNHNVGTVHTFQGKENSIVFLVLGCNRDDIGKAIQLVTKPNLLNVAATRAKDRFFIIGDYYLWKERYACFKQAVPILNKVTDADEFFQTLQKKVQENR